MSAPFTDTRACIIEIYIYIRIRVIVEQETNGTMSVSGRQTRRRTEWRVMRVVCTTRTCSTNAHPMHACMNACLGSALYKQTSIHACNDACLSACFLTYKHTDIYARTHVHTYLDDGVGHFLANGRRAARFREPGNVNKRHGVCVCVCIYRSACMFIYIYVGMRFCWPVLECRSNCCPERGFGWGRRWIFRNPEK